MYGAPAGWHWGSRAEVAAIMGGGEEMRQPKKPYYYDQGGWAGYIWGWMDRSYFVFSDSLQVGGSLCSFHGEGLIASGANLAEVLPKYWFAGIVCVAD